jgi:hypothetical protein
MKREAVNSSETSQNFCPYSVIFYKAIHPHRDGKFPYSVIKTQFRVTFHVFPPAKREYPVLDEIEVERY